MLLQWSLALIPVLIILILMVWMKWGASRAGPIGWVAAVVLARLAFGTSFQIILQAHFKALFFILDVLLIVWGAYLLYRVADEAGAIKTIGIILRQLTSDRGMLALLIGWAFASFLQGVGGFGVPVAVVAPLLAGLGFSELMAVIIPSIGHGWAVTFGSLASSFQALMAATGLPGEQLAPASALILGSVGVVSGLLVAHAADGRKAMWRLLIPVLTMGLVMGGTQYLLATAGFWSSASFGGGLAGLAVGYAFSFRFRGDDPEDGKTSLRTVLDSFMAYLILITIILSIQFIQPLQVFLSGVVLEIQFPELQTAQGFVTAAGPGRRIVLFRHTGMMLIYAALLAYLYYRQQGRYRVQAGMRILRGTVRKMVPSSMGIVATVAMALVMSHAGMIDVLARGLAQSVGVLFPLIAPWIGALGAFITGSNTNSNVIFAMLQMRTAELLGLGAVFILAAQTAGAAIGSVIAPSKVIVGASTAGMAGKEGEVMRVLAKYILIMLLTISGITWLVTLL